MKLMICGYARHGKDTFCELLGLPFISSSMAALEAVIWPAWGERHYRTPEECFDDRGAHREKWFELITAYNAHDRAKLGKYIYSRCDVYCGIRNQEEFFALKDGGHFDMSIWVDASGRKPPEDTSSNTMKPEFCDMIVHNNGTLDDLKRVANVLRQFKQG